MAFVEGVVALRGVVVVLVRLEVVVLPLLVVGSRRAA